MAGIRMKPDSEIGEGPALALALKIVESVSRDVRIVVDKASGEATIYYEQPIFYEKYNPIWIIMPPSRTSMVNELLIYIGMAELDGSIDGVSHSENEALRRAQAKYRQYESGCVPPMKLSYLAAKPELLYWPTKGFLPNLAPKDYERCSIQRNGRMSEAGAKGADE